MSTLEKNLYKRVSVSTSEKKKPEVGNSYRGFSTVNTNTENFALYDFELIKQDIINHFHIRKGEKLSDLNFGTIIWDMLFEPMTSENRELIIEDVTVICNYDPRVQVEEITVDDYEHGIKIECTLTYLKYNITENLLFRFDQSAIQD
jgi:phage baseplate assembly protein W